MTRAIIILPMGFEEMEAITPIDLLHRAGVSLTIAALTYPLQVTGRSRVEILADGPLDSYLNNQYELVILPGGPGTENYFSSLVLEGFLKSQKGIIAAICAAPTVLERFGFLKGKRYTCYPSVRDKLKDAVDDPVVVDGNIVTSTGPGTAFQFGIKLVELMEGKEKAAEVIKDTCWK